MTTDRAAMHRIACGEVWGGIKDADLSACTASLHVDLYSAACRGGRGGDIYYMTVCDSDMLTRIVVADVVGHGDTVSTVSDWVYRSLRANMGQPNGARLLEGWNRRLGEHTMASLTTAAMVQVVASQGRMMFCYAGHPPVLIRRAGDSRWEPLELSQPRGENLPLGLDTGTRYDQQSAPVGPGDRLLMYTDGVTEAMDTQGRQFGVDRLIDSLDTFDGAELHEVKAHVLERVRDHAGGEFHHDDVTLLLLEVSG